MNQDTRPVIAVDAMGGDHGPQVVVPGVIAALTVDSPFRAAFYGDHLAVEEALAECETDGLPITVNHCSEDIAMDESPASAIRNRKDSPIVRAMTDQKAGKVKAVVSAGSTGAMVAASLLILGRLKGVDRPAIATLIPTLAGRSLLLDAGANLQCTSDHLVTFAEMGNIYSREILGVPVPKVGLLNIGEESSKGTEVLVETHGRLAAGGLEFIGNIEGNHVLQGGCDVVVTDGFTGNITLKLLEGFALFMARLARSPQVPDALRASLPPILGYLQENFSYEVYGGAMLLGVEGISIISHGRSSSWAITNAVKVAWQQVEKALPSRLISPGS